MNLHLKSELQEYLVHRHSGGKQLFQSQFCQEQFVTTWEELLRILDFLLVSCSVTHLQCVLLVCKPLTSTLGLDFLPRKY